jgi:hypothetical protein
MPFSVIMFINASFFDLVVDPLSLVINLYFSNSCFLILKYLLNQYNLVVPRKNRYCALVFEL